MDTKMIYKTFRVDVRGVNTDEGTVDVLIPMSTGSIDRDDEIIKPSAWKKSLPKFKKRAILLSSHDYHDLRKQIGEFTQLKLTDEGLFAKPKYYINEGNEEADWAFNLASKNKAAYSVGFIPTAYEDGKDDKSPRRTYTEAELLEISHVVVPSNRDAMQTMMAKGIENPIICELCDEILKDIVQIICPYCGGEKVEPKPELGKTVWQCLECGKTFDTTTKPEESDEFIRIPNPQDTKNHDDHKIRTIKIDDEKGITALYCVDCKVVKTYVFAKDKGWTMAKAKKWVEDHSKNFMVIEIELDGEKIADKVLEIDELAKEAKIELDKPISQEELKDEIDYLKDSIEDVGMADETKKAALELVETIKRLAGNDIPDDIKEEDDEMKLEQILEIVRCTVSDVIAKAQGKV